MRHYSRPTRTRRHRVLGWRTPSRYLRVSDADSGRSQPHTPHTPLLPLTSVTESGDPVVDLSGSGRTPFPVRHSTYEVTLTTCVAWTSKPHLTCRTPVPTPFLHASFHSLCVVPTGRFGEASYSKRKRLLKCFLSPFLTGVDN